MNTQFTSGDTADREYAVGSLLVTPDTSKLDALLGYAAHGLKGFMLSASKVPVANCDWCTDNHHTNEQREMCQCLNCHGFYAATTDPDRLAAMVQRTPGGLVAVRTGLVSGVVLIDIDTLDAHGVDGMATAANLDRFGYLPPTASAETGTGGGHRLHAHPGGRIKGGTNRLGPGVDVKADGGYFVAAPSRHPKTGNPYRWHGDRVDFPLAPLHPRVVAHLQEKPIPERTRQPVNLPQFRDRYVTAAVEGEVQRILDTPRGGKGQLGRNEQLNKSAFILGTLVGAGALDQRDAENALTQAAYAVGLDHDTNCNPAQIARTIASGLTAGTRHPRRLQGVR